MYNDILRGLESPATTDAELPANCPTCDAEIQAIDARGPSTHHFTLCGCTLDTDSSTEPTPLADGGHQWADLSGFQRDLLFEIYRMETDEPHGLAIKRAVSQTIDQDVNHGRLYPNLDTLVQQGLIEKGELDRRTNCYPLTPEGRRLVETRAQLFAAAAPVEDTLTADGGIEAPEQR